MSSGVRKPDASSWSRPPTAAVRIPRPVRLPPSRLNTSPRYERGLPKWVTTRTLSRGSSRTRGLSTSTSSSRRGGFGRSWTHLPSRSVSSLQVTVAPFAATASSTFLSSSAVFPDGASGAFGPMAAAPMSGVRSQALEARGAGACFSSSATRGRPAWPGRLSQPAAGTHWISAARREPLRGGTRAAFGASPRPDPMHPRPDRSPEWHLSLPSQQRFPLSAN